MFLMPVVKLRARISFRAKYSKMANTESALKNEIRKTLQEEISRALANSSQKAFSPSPKNDTLTFEQFYLKRERDRQGDFVPKSKKKTRFPKDQKKIARQEDKEVEIKVSLAFVINCSRESICYQTCHSAKKLAKNTLTLIKLLMTLLSIHWYI